MPALVRVHSGRSDRSPVRGDLARAAWLRSFRDRLFRLRLAAVHPGPSATGAATAAATAAAASAWRSGGLAAATQGERYAFFLERVAKVRRVRLCAGCGHGRQGCVASATAAKAVRMAGQGDLLSASASGSRS